MSFTLIATRSMPMVSCCFMRKASLSLVPTPSVPETSTGFLVLLRDLDQRAETADAAQHFGAHRALGERLDALDQRVARVDVDAGIAVGERDVLGGHGRSA